MFHRHHVCIFSVSRFVLPHMAYFNSWCLWVNRCVFVSTIRSQGNPSGYSDPCCVVHLHMCATCRCEPRCHAEIGRHLVCASLRLHLQGLRSSRRHALLVSYWVYIVPVANLLSSSIIQRFAHIWDLNPRTSVIGMTMPATYSNYSQSHPQICAAAGTDLPWCHGFLVYPRIVYPQDPSCLHLFPKEWHKTLDGNPSREASFMYGLWN